MTKRILTMQDFSCVGQCSLTVALPLLSAYGVEAAALPTAVLSNHTMFKSWSYLDLTPEIKNIFKFWKENNFAFEGFLLGYLGKKELTELAAECFSEFSAEGAVKIIDPAFGDNGRLYGGFDEKYVAAMRGLAGLADIILPNVTEACFLTGAEYREKYDKAYIEGLLDGLNKITDGVAIITGVELEGGIGEAIRKDGKTEYVLSELLPKRLHGTGDIFAAVFAAKYLTGSTLAEASAEAGLFVADCIRKTPDEHFYGANFEEILASRKK